MLQYCAMRMHIFAVVFMLQSLLLTGVIKFEYTLFDFIRSVIHFVSYLFLRNID